MISLSCSSLPKDTPLPRKTKLVILSLPLPSKSLGYQACCAQVPRYITTLVSANLIARSKSNQTTADDLLSYAMSTFLRKLQFH